MKSKLVGLYIQWNWLLLVSVGGRGWIIIISDVKIVQCSCFVYVHAVEMYKQQLGQCSLMHNCLCGVGQDINPVHCFRHDDWSATLFFVLWIKLNIKSISWSAYTGKEELGSFFWVIFQTVVHVQCSLAIFISKLCSSHILPFPDRKQQLGS